MSRSVCHTTYIKTKTCLYTQFIYNYEQKYTDLQYGGVDDMNKTLNEFKL